MNRKHRDRPRGSLRSRSRGNDPRNAVILRHDILQLDTRLIFGTIRNARQRNVRTKCSLALGLSGKHVSSCILSRNISHTFISSIVSRIPVYRTTPHASRRDEICSARNASKLSRTQLSLPLFSNQNDEADSVTPWPFAFVCRFGNETTTTVDIMETIRTRERTPISHHGRQVTSFACEFDEFLRALARKMRSFYLKYLSNLYCRPWRRFALII